MGIPRLISLFLLAVGLYLLGQDVANLVTGTGGGPQSLGALWTRLDSAGLNAAQRFTLDHVPAIWDPGMTTLLRLPAWTLPLGLGLVILVIDIFSQRRGCSQHN